MRTVIISVSMVILLLLQGCAVTGSKSPAQKREAVQLMKEQVLTDLYATKPSVRSQINAAPGYAVFNNANVNVILASFGGGYGVVHDNQTGRDTYMRMGELGVGFGAGVKDFSAVFVFHNQDVMERFVRYGWAFGAQADAAAKAGEAGAAAAGEVVTDNMTIYQLTESGLALQATIKGTKFWVDEELNPQ